MENHINSQVENIIKLLREKAVMKQNVYSNTIECFEILKSTSKKVADELIKSTKQIDSRVTLNFKELNQHSFQLKVAGDILHFDMHTNVFEIEKSNPIYKSGYVKQGPFNSYSGIISVYNFLADSFKYNRTNDVGFLIARIFINREKKFFIETKTNLNHRYSNFSDEPITQNNLIDIINELIIFSINFDLTIPPYDAVKQVSVYEMQEKASSAVLRTGKRLGYIGSSDEGGIEDETNL